eukprot:16439953-Heterocapsa_arctica.AAC.2
MRTRAEQEAQMHNKTIATTRNDRSAIGVNTMPFIAFEGSNLSVQLRNQEQALWQEPCIFPNKTPSTPRSA